MAYTPVAKDPPSVKDANYRYQQIFNKLNQMCREKTPIIIAYVEELIEDHIKSNGKAKIIIHYGVINEKADYIFPAHVIRNIISRHYQPLGFEIDDPGSNPKGFFLEVVEKKEEKKSCNCLLM